MNRLNKNFLYFGLVVLASCGGGDIANDAKIVVECETNPCLIKGPIKGQIKPEPDNISSTQVPPAE